MLHASRASIDTINIFTGGILDILHAEALARRFNDCFPQTYFSWNFKSVN